MPYLLILLMMVSCTEMDPKAIKNPLDVERLFSSPNLNGDELKSPKLAPQGANLAYLKSDDEDAKVLNLWLHDLDEDKKSLLVSAKELAALVQGELSDQEKSRRERLRISSKGVVEFFWLEDGKSLLIPYQEKLFIADLQGKIKKISEKSCYDPRPSPNGQYVACVRDHNLWIIDLKADKSRALTQAGSPKQPIGVADFIAQEEMGRTRGFWWSPDSQVLAYTQVDTSPLKTQKRFEFYPQGLDVIEQAYPFAGTDNVTTKLFVQSLQDNKAQEVSLGDNSDVYLPHVQWHPDPKPLRLSYQIQNRPQTQIDFWLYELKTRKASRILSETDPAWVNISHDFQFIEGQEALIWPSERSGHRHLWQYDLKSPDKPPQQLTQGDWSVLKLHRADKDHIFFTGNKNSHRQSQFYRLSLNDMSVDALSKKPGWHEITTSSKGEYYLDQYSSLTTPSQLWLGHLPGEQVSEVLVENQVESKHPLKPHWEGLGQWHFGEVLHEDVRLSYSLLLPANFKGSTKYPLIHFVYGGPGVQLTRDQWMGTRGLFLHLLSQKGYVVLLSDNRGTPGRGRDFERAYKHNFGQIEVKDQSTVLENVLQEHPFIDSERVGVFGHSYGGYLTLMLMMQRPDLYKAGVSGAPVVDWALYDTHYTERYMGSPQEQEKAYETAHVLSHSKGLKGRLLLIHGMADDNVLFTHSTQLMDKLQDEKRLFNIMVYPGAKHSLRKSKSIEIHHHKTLLDHFQNHL